jgi:hypothetical protein
MGRLIRKAIERGKKVTILVEYHPELHTSLVDRIPYIGLKDKFPDCTVKFVADMGPLKTALVTHSASHAQHYFTDQEDTLPFSNEWGTACNRLFADGQVLAVQETPAPTYPPQATEVIRQGMATVTQFPVGKYFSRAIAPCTLHKEDVDTLRALLAGQRVNIAFSDMYVNSALASLMLVHLIKEMRDLFGFTIRSLTLQLDSIKRKCSSPGFSPNTVINYNFLCKEDADSYTDELCFNELGIQPVHSSQDANHHRWLRIELPGGKKVEIRPDHGISGGYHSHETYMDIDNLDEQTLVYRNNEDVLYYVLIKSN